MPSSSAEHRAFCARLVTHHHLPPPVVMAAAPGDLPALAAVFPSRAPARAPPSDRAGIHEAITWLAPRIGRTRRDIDRLTNRELFDLTRRAVGDIAAAATTSAQRRSSGAAASPRHSIPRHSSPRVSSPRGYSHMSSSPRGYSHMSSSPRGYSHRPSSPRVTFAGASSETFSLMTDATGRLRRETRVEELAGHGVGGVRLPLPAGEVEELLVRFKTDAEARFTKHQMRSMRALTKDKERVKKDAADALRRRALAVNSALAANGALRRTRSGGRSGIGAVPLPQARGAATGGIVRRRSSRGLDKK